MTKRIFLTILSAFVIINFSFADNHDKFNFSKTVVFQSFHDPGYLLSKKGVEYYFHYVGFTYENISTWRSGRKLLLTYSPENGILMFDPVSRAKAKVTIINGKHPIDEIKDSCLEERHSTMGMASCYEDSYRSWDNEMNRVYKELKIQCRPEKFKIIQKMQRSWLKYRDNRFESGRVIHADDQGTISIIESSARAVAPVKDQALFLLSLLENIEFYKNQSE